MTRSTRSHLDDLRGATHLAVEATRGVIGLVQAMHRVIASGPGVIGSPLEGPATLLTDLVYAPIRGVTDAVALGIDAALDLLTPLLGESTPGLQREAVQAAINGVLGDYLESTRNPLSITPRFRRGGVPLVPSALEGASSRLLVLVHGSCMNDLQWRRNGHDHGASLEAKLGYTAVYWHYNSGLNISTNGHALAAQLEALVAAWPTEVREVALLGHSMGGLIARSACHYGAESRWRSKLRKLACIGSPHHGAPLERGGNWVDVLLGVSRYSAPLAKLGQIRSAGVTDLRFGNVLDEHWAGRDRFELELEPHRGLPLPRGVDCYAIAATKSASSGDMLKSDGMVPVASGLGQHERPELCLDFPEEHRLVVYRTDHLGLLDCAEAYDALGRWL